jgi:hypothetical protein
MTPPLSRDTIYQSSCASTNDRRHHDLRRARDLRERPPPPASDARRAPPPRRNAPTQVRPPLPPRRQGHRLRLRHRPSPDLRRNPGPKRRSDAFVHESGRRPGESCGPAEGRRLTGSRRRHEPWFQLLAHCGRSGAYFNLNRLQSLPASSEQHKPDERLPAEVDQDLMMLESLAALDRPQVPDDAEMAVAHASEMAVLEVPHVVSMHWPAIPSILDRLESSHCGGHICRLTFLPRRPLVRARWRRRIRARVPLEPARLVV